jgi:hypothetical protein
VNGSVGFGGTLGGFRSLVGFSRSQRSQKRKNERSRSSRFIAVIGAPFQDWRNSRRSSTVIEPTNRMPFCSHQGAKWRWRNSRCLSMVAGLRLRAWQSAR